MSTSTDSFDFPPNGSLLGGHVSTAGGLHESPPRAARLHFGTMQIFVKNQRQWRAPDLAEEQAGAFQAAMASAGLRRVLAHASYLVNLASPREAVRRKSVGALGDELDRCRRLGIQSLVLHPGSHGGSGEEEGLVTVSRSLDECLGNVDAESVRILLETTAGQGTSLGYRLEHLARIFERTRFPDRIAVCVDTCHVFAAGYEISKPDGWEAFWHDFDHLLGPDALAAVHINDSKKPLASKVDRHELLGRGHLGTFPFLRLLQESRFTGIPLVLETPEGEKHYAEEVTWLKRLHESADF